MQPELGTVAVMTGVEAPAERHVPFETVFNFRDLGGYAAANGATVKWRTLYRADGIHRLSLDDIAPLGLHTVLDLRTPEEHERAHFAHDSVGFHHLPILQASWDRDAFTHVPDAVEFLSDRYVDMLTEGRDSIAGALRIMANADAFPLVFHCAAGKDRTGVVAAIVLSILGVSDDDIAADYSLSGHHMARFKDWIITTFPDAADAMTKQPDAFLEAPAEAMDRFLHRVSGAFGSVEGYVAELGIGHHVVDAVRENLLT
jgi:protein-tyrosine phosphatase